MGIFKQTAAAQSAPATGRAAAGCKAMTRRWVLLGLCLAVAATNELFAQESGLPPDSAQSSAAAPGITAASKPWAALAPEQQQLLQKYQGQWSSLPAERQQSLVFAIVASTLPGFAFLLILNKSPTNFRKTGPADVKRYP